MVEGRETSAIEDPLNAYSGLCFARVLFIFYKVRVG